MPYIENRIVHDADSHTMELPNWLDEYAEKSVQIAFRERFNGNKGLHRPISKILMQLIAHKPIKTKMKKV